MAKISLRDYLSGIEELIEDGRTEDALAHCRYILTLFPKNIATYRLMGKTYLEAHQHSEARDIFQRVLSSCPDDFVSHIGMSIINEESNDLDASIWNMERAFESQPSNRAVQDELRRLYGKREGYAPPKVRLTRGALARMYAHGDLYNQAIGELRSALAEDPQRPDLQVLLAEMYFKTKRDTDAIEVCSKLIEKLPYCLYANRVMVDILRGSQRDLEAKPYLERVEEMDPYAALVETRIPIDSAPADTVMLEQHIIETPEAKEQPIPRAWTGSLNLEGDGFEKEALPDWLSVENVGEQASEEKGEGSKGPAVMEFLESLEPIPTGDLGSAPPKRTSAALSEDQIPEWLRELRPATSSITGEGQKTSTSEFLPQAEEASVFGADESAGEKGAVTESAPAFIAEDIQVEGAAPETAAPETPTVDDEDLGWLEKLAAQQGAPEEELLIKPEDREAAKPEWLPEGKPEPKRDVLAWLDEMAAESEPASAESQAVAEPQIEKPAGQTTPFAEKDKVGTSGSTPAWLKDLSAEVGQEASSGEAAEEITPRPLEEEPDWLSELRPSTDEITAAENAVEETVSAETEQPEPAEDLGKLDWLEELGPPKITPTKAEWVPETQMAGNGGEGNRDAPVQVPVMSPRRTAALQAEQEAPGRLEQARQALNFSKLDDAADHYGYLLRRRLMIKDVIADLDAAVHRHPSDATLWQTLGDAYMRNNQLREALDCYTRAEDLL